MSETTNTSYRCVWEVIHFLSLTIDHLDDTGVCIVKDVLINMIPEMLLCDICRAHYTNALIASHENIKGLPNDLSDIASIRSSYNLFMWTVALHNDINRAANKEVLTLFDALGVHFYRNEEAFSGEVFYTSKRHFWDVIAEFEATELTSILRTDKKKACVEAIKMACRSLKDCTSPLELVTFRNPQPIPLSKIPSLDVIHRCTSAIECDGTCFAPFREAVAAILARIHVRAKLHVWVVLLRTSKWVETMLHILGNGEPVSFIGKTYTHFTNDMEVFTMNDNMWNLTDVVGTVLKVGYSDSSLSEIRSIIRTELGAAKHCIEVSLTQATPS